MAVRSLILGTGKLTISDLMAAIDGVRVRVDEEAGKQLSQAEEGGSQFESDQGSADPFLRGSVLVRLHALLKVGDQVRASLVQNLANLMNERLRGGTLKDIGSELVMTSNEMQAYLSATTPHVVALGVAVGKLRSFLPLAFAGFAIFLEAYALNHGFLNVEAYPVTYRGLKSILQDLESLLENSKLVKNSPDSFGPEVLEAPQVLGHLRDSLDTAARIVEAEINEEVKLNQQIQIMRSLRPVQTQTQSLLACVTALVELTKARLGRVEPGFSGDETPTELHAAVDYLVYLNAREVAACLVVLQAKESKMNEGLAEGKPRKQLPYGKGVKQVISFLSTLQERLVDELRGFKHSDFIEQLLQAKNEERRVPKIPKGMRDYGPEQMAIRSQVFQSIRKVFQQHLAGELDTPVMELKETLTGKYGEEGSKLIYELADQGGEILALRYDLTVPLARYVAMNRITKLKRFHIGKVYRRDQPQQKKGRYREFYQCDFDIVGAGALMVQEAECLKIVSEILTDLHIPFLLKVNHRKLLDACLEIAGCPSSKFRTVSSSIDKLDKEPWTKILEELISEKGIAPETADAIGEFVKIHGPVESTATALLTDPRMQQHATASKVLQDMIVLASFLKCLGVVEKVEFDLSLARGLDYYTGLVYEAVVTDNKLGLGSIGGGGRYDELIQKLNNSKTPTPAVGVSLGIERLFTLVEQQTDLIQVSSSSLSILVAQAGKSSKYNLFEERWRLCCQLWEHNIAAETSYKEKSDPEGQAHYAAEAKLTWIIWVGEEELDAGVVKAKNMREHSETLVPQTDLVAYLKAQSA